MSSDVVDFTYDADGKAVFHDSCVTDLDQPTFDAEWQRRAFGLAVALSEFRHYEWTDFQQALIGEIGAWEKAPADARGRWEYYEHWVSALHEVVAGHGLLEEGYVNPEDRDEHDDHQPPAPTVPSTPTPRPS